MCRANVRRRKAGVVGSKLAFGRGVETDGIAGVKPNAQSYRVQYRPHFPFFFIFLPAGACPPFNPRLSVVLVGSGTASEH